MSQINILCGFDDAYAPHFATMTASLFAVTHRARDVRIHVVKCLLSPAVRDCLDRVFARHRSGEIQWLDVDCSPFADAPVTMHFTRATYARIAAFEVLRVKRVVYLDVDLICLADLGMLCGIDLGGATVGAVLDPGSTFGANEHNTKLGLPLGNSWFNCGVLVVDVPRWREQRLTGVCLDFLDRVRSSILWVDQDILNGVFAGRWCKLPSAWNVQTHFFKPKFRELLAANIPGELEAIKVPRIIHFNDPAKPWHLGYGHPYRDQYLRHLARSGWPHRITQVTRNGFPDREVEFDPLQPDKTT